MDQKSIETGPAISKYQVTICFNIDDDFMALVPSHRTYINYLINKGIIDTYTVSMESQRSWILINAFSKKEVEDYITNLILDGIVQEDEKPNLVTKALEVLENTDLKAVLSKATGSISEKNIIDAKGKLHRPDRILFNKDEVIILDYKFTLEESDKHIEQVNTYKVLLSEMGYQYIKAYLFYAVKGNLKLV